MFNAQDFDASNFLDKVENFQSIIEVNEGNCVEGKVKNSYQPQHLIVTPAARSCTFNLRG